LALPDVTSLAEVAEVTVAHRRIALLLLGLFAALALSLAGIGIYGVISYVVAQSTSEMGVRMVLGATRGEIVRLIAGKGLRSASAGVMIGLLLSLAAARFLSALLYEVSAFDPVIYATVPVVALSAAVVACLIPALRASNTDPLSALRHG
jgi:putative ABC transport system permease protein